MSVRKPENIYGEPTARLMDGINADLDALFKAANDVTAVLTNTAVTPGGYGDSTHVATFTVNAQGRLTAAASVAISGTVAAHNLLSTTHGDTVTASPVLGDLIYGNATPAWQRLAGQITTTRKFLRQTGTGAVSAVPAWDTVTATDVGLGSVENTALSTWGGSANLVTLGTVGTGTWHGTVVGLLYGGTGANLSGVAKGGLISGTGAGTVGVTTVGTDGQVLSADAASAGGIKWVAPSGGGGGASTALDNLASVAINAALVLSTAAGFDLGSAAKPWKDLWLAGSSGTPGTNHYQITGASTGGLRTLTLADGDTTLVAGTMLTTSATTLSSLATIGTITTGVWHGTAVGVAYGGTGLATLTLNNVLLGNGTSTPQFVAPGTSGNVLTSDGTTWASSAPPGGGTVSLSAANIWTALNTFRADNIQAVVTNRLLLDNTTAATSPVPRQIAPAIEWKGAGWTGAASQEVDVLCYLDTNSGVNPVIPTFHWQIGRAASLTDVLLFTYDASSNPIVNITAASTAAKALQLNAVASWYGTGTAVYTDTELRLHNGIRLGTSLASNQPNFQIDTSTGVHRWGAGSASATDTTLYRSAAGVLKTDKTLSIGLSGTQTGTILLNGTTSGTITVKPADAAGTWTLTLPTSGGTAAYSLQTDGSGVTTWTRTPHTVNAVEALTQTASIGTTNIIASAAGSLSYAVHVMATCEASGTGTAFATIGWTDTQSNTAVTRVSATLSLAAAGGAVVDTFVIRPKAATALTYATTYASTGTYALYIYVEQL